MTILSAQAIRRLCQGKSPLITPFVERGVLNGLSYGLSACTYDCRIAQGINLEVCCVTLVSTVERFCLPANVCGSVLDKSSFARLGVSTFNTHLNPGWEGWLTVELINLSPVALTIPVDSPICQIKFEWLDDETCLPYRSKYQNQENWPVGVRRESLSVSTSASRETKFSSILIGKSGR